MNVCAFGAEKIKKEYDLSVLDHDARHLHRFSTTVLTT